MAYETDRDPASAAPDSPVRRARRPAWPWALALAAVVAAFLLYALPRYTTLDPALAGVPLHPGFPAHYPLLVVHIASGTIAMLAVCVQVWPRIRRRWPAVHRASGRIYVFGGVLPSAVASLVLVPWAFEGQPVGGIGNTLVAVVWAVVAVLGVVEARRRRFDRHRMWMVYGIALTLHIVWGRALPFVFEWVGIVVPGQVIKEGAGWFGAAVNLLIAHWWLRRTARPARSGAAR
ncbi:DUF2306 domain-containing protein [Nocardiopsis mangrovi]|uniref:DUF2306 domain-containing protein n=1 Tax=Nocardiopsis mangrovi TaxID=1179818 RepID=A0ABV9DQ27_9ACTN